MNKAKTIGMWVIAALLLLNALSPALAGKAPTTAQRIATLEKQVAALTKQNKTLSDQVGTLSKYPNTATEARLANLAKAHDELQKFTIDGFTIVNAVFTDHDTRLKVLEGR